MSSIYFKFLWVVVPAYCLKKTNLQLSTQKLNWQQASLSCEGFGRSGSLWSPSSVEDQTALEKQVQRRQLAAVWTALRKTYLESLTWVDGNPETDTKSTGKCLAFLTGQGQRTLPCWATAVGALCQKDYCRSCQGRSLCAVDNNKCYMWSDKAMPWHISARWCSNEGWYLAVVQDSVHFRNLWPYNLQQRYYWIGLRGVDWKYLTSTARKDLPFELNLWHIDEPKGVYNCVVSKRIDNIWFWFTEDCAKSHHFVCEVEIEEGPVSIMSSQRSMVTSEKPIDRTTFAGAVLHGDEENSGTGGGGINAVIIGALCGVLLLVGVLVSAFFIYKKCFKKTEEAKSLKRQESVAYHCAPDDPSSSRANTLTRAMCPLPTVPDDHPPETMAPNPRYSRAPICSQVVTRKLQNITIMPEDDYESIGERLQDHFYSDLLITEDKVMDLIMKAVKTQLTKACNMSSDMRRSLIHTTTRAFVEEYLDPIEQDMPRKALLAIEGPKAEEEVAPETNLDAVAVSKETPGSEQGKEETGDQNEKETNEDTAPKDDAQTVEEVKRVLANLLKERVNKQEAEKKSA